ncbi:aldo-keto reductase AKR2E4 isoform X1 [Spodoptera frugiperda]|uniref:Aldo-keto reductase AKR2E4 isoform X1 n=1 Tax=Spodoptera frugiperda TaxID=7108 RepID=A0A9R0E4L0_SPOFR|nr:aldo-keto reductase AKR2E4 isoform X1 [Spodoptera frugiperda]XP_050558708.1 aldo-keto reductase AKR2E4 isoform X1 [Spodoptera frugiperda]
MSKRTLEEFKRDYNLRQRILRPDPDVEGALDRATEVTEEIAARVKTYNQDFRKRKKYKPGCCCQEAVTRPGVAPLVQLNDGREIPNLGLGTWLGFNKAGAPEPVVDDKVQHAVEAAIDAGYRHIDTAAIYETEEQVGIAIQNKIAEGVVAREDLFITSKLWNDRHAKKDVVPALKESLARLNLTYLDLYLIHWPIAQYENGTYYDTDYVETWKGMIDAQVLGLARSIGVSNFNRTQLDRLLTMTTVKPAVLQIEVNLNLQQPQMIKFCKEHGIAVVGYTPFGSLFHNRAAPNAPPPRTDNQTLLKISDKYHKTIAQVNLRYLIELGVIPIPKSVTPKRIGENIEVFDFQLTQRERDLMRAFDKNYRTIPVTMWEDSPYYPFHKK